MSSSSGKGREKDRDDHLKPPPQLYPFYPDLPPRPQVHKHAYYIQKSVKLKQRLRISPYYLTKPTVTKSLERYVDKYYKSDTRQKEKKLLDWFPKRGDGMFPGILLKNAKYKVKKTRVQIADLQDLDGDKEADGSDKEKDKDDDDDEKDGDEDNQEEESDDDYTLAHYDDDERDDEGGEDDEGGGDYV
eukprot:TRINITY_DN5943_c0_g1_i1.p1 TRINITY_DN5943_c0_g1~~TRINITY_DN5943_c0_g1_i1.p1  ORF type:complete len:201 (-),score=38.35 TRINITY_DN5943_c0_g1_i1:8-571(-)